MKTFVPRVAGVLGMVAVLYSSNGGARADDSIPDAPKMVAVGSCDDFTSADVAFVSTAVSFLRRISCDTPVVSSMDQSSQDIAIIV